MPGNPEECRRHALACVRLAQTSATPQGRDHFAKLARTWIRLAEDLERNPVLYRRRDRAGRADGLNRKATRHRRRSAAHVTVVQRNFG